MATPTPVEDWELGKDNRVGYSGTLQVAVTQYSGDKSRIYIDFENDDYIVAHDLSPEQARALATMLLYAAEQVDPSGD